MTIAPVNSEVDFEAARMIRREVFIEEQDCPPEEEWYGHDNTARHVLARTDDGDAVGTARWRTVPHNDMLVAKLERFAVRKPHRGKGIGTALVHYTIEEAERAGFDTQKLHAQAHLEAYYARFGFASTGKRFTEAGISHVAMVRTSASSVADQAATSLAVGGTSSTSSRDEAS